MGALHEGHISLIMASKAENDISTASIFVNPLQFNNPLDLDKYPRTLDNDLSMLADAGCDLVFVPENNEMYPEPVSREFDFGALATVMEGRFRPGHFNGVAIVVERLFRLMRPHRAYFGEKDFQQLMIVKRLVEICQLDLEIVPCPIIREADGLAMSSRNRRLSAEQRLNAPLIFQTLTEIAARSQNQSPAELREMAMRMLSDNPCFEPEYVEICREDTLEPLNDWEVGVSARAFVAAFMGEIRLIDNMPILRNFAGYAN